MNKSKKIGLDGLSGLVFSTNPEAMREEPAEAVETPEAGVQQLRVVLDKKHRKGKIVTLVEGFEGNEEDFQKLAKDLKTKCGTGGSAKDNIILIQGDYKTKITQWLLDWGYKKTKSK